MLRENAGYIIIKAERQQWNKNFEVVLGMNVTKYGTKYVTWECKAGYDYFWGHYFDNELDAIIDYYERLMKEAMNLKN